MKTRIVRSSESQAFPFVESFGDYHDIEYQHSLFKKHFGNVCAREIAFDGNYWGVFWIRGERPTRKNVIKMLINAGLDAKYTKKSEGFTFR